MLNDIHSISKPFGLNLHLGKTKAMFNKHAAPANVVVNAMNIEQVESYIYLGRTILQDGNLLQEVKKRMKLGWAAFGEVDDIMRSKNASMKVKRNIFNECVLPVTTYSSETWALNNNMEDRISVAQCKMELIMFGISLRGQKCNTWICRHTKTEDIITASRWNKHRWAGHLARFMDNRWMIRATEWSPRPCKQLRGQPKIRWCNNLTHHLRSTLAAPSLCRPYPTQAVQEGFLLRESYTPCSMFHVQCSIQSAKLSIILFHDVVLWDGTLKSSWIMRNAMVEL